MLGWALKVGRWGRSDSHPTWTLRFFGLGVGRGHSCHWSLDLAGEDDLEAMKAKNIKQTELVADLREAILRVARHFQCTDPKNCNVVSLGAPPWAQGVAGAPLS